MTRQGAVHQKGAVGLGKAGVPEVGDRNDLVQALGGAEARPSEGKVPGKAQHHSILPSSSLHIEAAEGEAAHTGVSTLGKMLITTFCPFRSRRACTRTGQA